MLTVHWLSTQDQAGSVMAQSMTAAMTLSDVFFGEQQPDSDEPGLEPAAPTVPKPDLKKYEKMSSIKFSFFSI